MDEFIDLTIGKSISVLPQGKLPVVQLVLSRVRDMQKLNTGLTKKQIISTVSTEVLFVWDRAAIIRCD